MNALLIISRYNSAVFEALSTNEYNVFVVTEGFLSGAPWISNTVRPTDQYSADVGPRNNLLQYYEAPVPIHTVQYLQDNVKALEHLDKASCMKAYRNHLVSDRRNVLAVTSSPPVNSSNLLDVLSAGPNTAFDPTRWICSLLPEYGTKPPVIPCDVNVALQHVDSWTLGDKTVEYCLSERVDEHCQLQFSQTIMIVVIVCNFLKVCCMLSAIFGHLGESLVTTG